MSPREFTDRTEGLRYEPHGVLFSELYRFVVACADRGVTAVAESGVRNGGSTRVLRRFVDLTSFEKNPAWVNAREGQVLGLLLDGPKGPKGDVVRRWCLEQPHVACVAQHDCPPGRDEDWHSQDRSFRAETGDALDARVPADVLARFYAEGKGLGIWFGRAA